MCAGEFVAVEPTTAAALPAIFTVGDRAAVDLAAERVGQRRRHRAAGRRHQHDVGVDADTACVSVAAAAPIS